MPSDLSRQCSTKARNGATTLEHIELFSKEGMDALSSTIGGMIAVGIPKPPNQLGQGPIFPSLNDNLSVIKPTEENSHGIVLSYYDGFLSTRVCYNRMVVSRQSRKSLEPFGVPQVPDIPAHKDHIQGDIEEEIEEQQIRPIELNDLYNTPEGIMMITAIDGYHVTGVTPGEFGAEHVLLSCTEAEYLVLAQAIATFVGEEDP